MIHEIEIYVRFSETDAAGHINNASYFFYFEEGRIKLMEEIGSTIGEGKLITNLILASTTCDYISQAYAGQILKLTTAVSRIGNKSFTLHHKLTQAKDGILVARASATMVYFNFTEQKSQSIPQDVRDRLERYRVKDEVKSE